MEAIRLNNKETPAATLHKVQRRGKQKKATSKNPEKPLRHKRSTVNPQSHAFERAKEIQANLPQEFPSLIKIMLRSHVSGGFWLGLPKRFCEVNLPKADTMIVLEDETGRIYNTKYLTDKVGLSGGWRGFSIEHKLLEGDALVLHLVEPTKFKVYIIRSNEMDVALSLLSLDTCTRQDDSDVPQENDQNSCQMICDANIAPADRPGNTSEPDEKFDSEALNGIRLSEYTITFQEVTSIENFSVAVNGLVIDSELSEFLKTKYYEICCSQRMFLHEHLLEGLNCKLVAGIICETINIADAIRASKITTPLNSFGVWRQTLKAFQSMGMHVNFLLARLDQLMNLASKSKRCIEARLEREEAEAERRVLERRLEEVRETINRLDGEIESQNLTQETLEAEFEEVANSPW